MRVVQTGDVNLVKELLSKGADPLKTDGNSGDISSVDLALQRLSSAETEEIRERYNLILHLFKNHCDRTFSEDISTIHKEEQDQDSTFDKSHKSMKEKAENLVFACRTLLGVIQPSLYRDFPELLTIPDDTRLTYFGTIAFVWTACARLHFDAAKEDRTQIELIIQDQLKEWHPNAIAEYEKAHNFISQNLSKEPDRKKRGDLLFKLAGKWVVSRITNEEDVKGKGLEIAK